MRRKYGRDAFLLVINHTKEFALRRVPCQAENVAIYEIYDENEFTGQRWQGYDPHWDLLLENVRLRQQPLDLKNDTFFENFFGCERGENGFFRWSMGDSVLHLEPYGGTSCRIDFSAPTPAGLTISNVYGETLYTFPEAGSGSFCVDIDHTTRYLTLHCKTWSPADLLPVKKRPFDLFHARKMPAPDTRQLGICLNSVVFERHI